MLAITLCLPRFHLTDQTPLNPVGSSERIVPIDIIRAMALFGVLLMNLPTFSGLQALERLGTPAFHGRLDLIMNSVFEILVHGKAMACFAMLFGVGLFIQFERAQARGIRPVSFALRRLGALLLIGAFHFTVIWNGDILLDYALVGFTLLLFLKAKPRTYVLAAVGIFIISDLIPFLVNICHLDPRWSVFGWTKPIAKEADAICGHQGWVQCLAWRASLWKPFYQVAKRLDSVTYILPFFLMGSLLWRMGLPKHPEKHKKALTQIFHSTFWCGLILCFLATDPLHIIPESWKKIGNETPWLVLGDIGTFLLAAGYFSGLLRLLSNLEWSKRMAILAPMGRMALTNYLSQSLIFTWVFYHHGLGLWGRVRPSIGFLMVIVFYGFQVLLSRWWLDRFRFGPAEWLWRSMTYGQWQPFRIVRMNSPNIAVSDSGV
jgi:uncharacterized protein